MKKIAVHGQGHVSPHTYDLEVQMAEEFPNKIMIIPKDHCHEA